MIYKIATFLFKNKTERDCNKLYELYSKKHKISKDKWDSILEELSNNNIIAIDDYHKRVRINEYNYYKLLQTKPKWYEKSLYKSIAAIAGISGLISLLISFFDK